MHSHDRGKRYIMHSPVFVNIALKKNLNSNVKLQISLTLVSILTLGTSNSFKEEEIIYYFSQAVKRAEVSVLCIPNVLSSSMDDALKVKVIHDKLISSGLYHTQPSSPKH